MFKIKLHKIIRNLLYKLRKLYLNGTVMNPQIFNSCPQEIKKLWAKFASPNRYFTENSRWVPLSITAVCWELGITNNTLLLTSIIAHYF